MRQNIKNYNPLFINGLQFAFKMKIETSCRNLLLFFEENEDKNNISSNLVRLYMNRFVIEEEKRYEIIGTFNLSKVSHSGTNPDRQSNKSYYEYNTSYRGRNSTWRVKSDEMFEKNWNKDKQIIETALNDREVFTNVETFMWKQMWNVHVETHIIIGTSIYMDHFHKSLNKLIPFWNSRIQKMNPSLKRPGLTLPKPPIIYSSVSHNKLTLLNGWKTTFSTKDEVRQAYFDSKKKYKDKTISVNDDLEELSSRGFNPHKFQDPDQNAIKTFLYEMLSDDEMEKQQSSELQFLRSDCRRLTVALY